METELLRLQVRKTLESSDGATVRRRRQRAGAEGVWKHGHGLRRTNLEEHKS